MNRRARLVKARLAELRPTQMSLGYAEVAHKRKEWRAMSPGEATRFLRARRFPAVHGPGGHYYIIDHHHLARALQEEKVEAVTLTVVGDLAHLDKIEFWFVMATHQWAHPYDSKGRLRDVVAMPKRLKQLVDDPYRSLVAAVRRAGNYPKDAAPFAEFLWADFLRRRIPAKTLRDDPQVALRQARRLLSTRAAAHLPDWRAKG
jgi:hypothetical protein